MSREHRRRMFLAGPFKAIVDPDTGTVREPHRSRFEGLIDRFERDGWQVDNAHRREGWGAAFLAPEECTELDFAEIAAADVVVAFPGSPASPGTHVEIGWASALGKPLVLVLDEGEPYAFLVRGLHAVADVSYVTAAAGDEVVALADRVEDAVRAAVGRRAT